MRQVTWPTRHEVVITTFVVIVAVAFFGVFFFGVDSTVGYVLQRVFNFFKHIEALRGRWPSSGTSFTPIRALRRR